MLIHSNHSGLLTRVSILLTITAMLLGGILLAAITAGGKPTPTVAAQQSSIHGASGATDFKLASVNKVISAKALNNHGCDDTEWGFVITQVDSEANAPASIHVTWANGAQEDVELSAYTGKTAHYITTDNLNSRVTSATAVIYDSWSGEFNLSHGPCVIPTPTETPIPPTNTPVPPTNTPTDTPVPPTNTPTNTPVITSTNTPVPPTNTPTNTPVPPTNTPVLTPTNTLVPPTNTPVITPTNTLMPPTSTPVLTPTNTLVPPTNTPVLTPTNTPVRPTNTPVRPTNTPVRPTNTPVRPTNTPVRPMNTPTPGQHQYPTPTNVPPSTPVRPTNTPITPIQPSPTMPSLQGNPTETPINQTEGLGATPTPLNQTEGLGALRPPELPTTGAGQQGLPGADIPLTLILLGFCVIGSGTVVLKQATRRNRT